MLKVKNLSYSYPDKELYKDVTFTIEDNRHCAFIGSNGTGKSTLIDMIMNKDDYIYDGKIEINDNNHIGYVSQFSDMDPDCETTVFDYLSEEFISMNEDMNVVCDRMADAENIELLMEEYQIILDNMARADFDNYEVNIRKKLKLAGLDNKEKLEINKLSGGEFKLIQVMKEMLVVPDIMIMDEPDVYLDFENLNALKELINSYKGTLLVITHNRYLLRNCFDKIIHLEDRQIQEYDGSYMAYNLELLKTKIELSKLAAADTEEIERNKKIVEKLRKDATMFSNAALGRSLHARVSLVERLEARRIKAPFLEIKEPEIVFEASENCDEKMDTEETVLEVNDYHLEFEDKILENVSFLLKKHDKVAIVGANGTGKSTLLRAISDNNNKAININSDTKMAFLSQIPAEMLNEDNTVTAEFELMGFENDSQVKEYLSGFCIGEDMLYSRIKTLSGGEKNILQLAKICLNSTDLLLLDEPNSHLDLHAQKSLERAIADYNGTVLMVSHDFYTVANCMDYVLFVEDNTIRRMSIRKFRKMIYANHFDKDYLEKEQKRKETEDKVTKALIANDFDKAEKLADELENIIKSM